MSNEIPGALITGAGSGIGAAIAKLFSQKGHPVCLVGRRREKLESIAAVLKTPALVVARDIGQQGEAEKILKETREKMKINFLVNCAGLFERGSFVSQSDEVWHRIFDVNLFGPVALCREFVGYTRELGAGGVIVNIASTAGLRPVSGMSAYVTSKAALIGFSQSLALEVAPDNIRVHCVCPGIIDTPIHAKASMDERKSWNDMHPLGRSGQPEDVAYAVLALCEKGAEWMTGTVLPVDGGIALK